VVDVHILDTAQNVYFVHFHVAIYLGGAHPRWGVIRMLPILKHSSGFGIDLVDDLGRDDKLVRVHVIYRFGQDAIVLTQVKYVARMKTTCLAAMTMRERATGHRDNAPSLEKPGTDGV
jgi:hypothetical protein